MLGLNIVKQHLRLEPDITDDDEFIQGQLWLMLNNGHAGSCI